MYKPTEANYFLFFHFFSQKYTDHGVPTVFCSLVLSESFKDFTQHWPDLVLQPDTQTV